MNGYELSYEEIYGLDEDDTEEDKLRSKVEKLKMENEDLKDEVYYLKKQKKDVIDTLLKMLSDE